MKFSEYTNKNTEETLKILNSSKYGLSEKEAEDRLTIYGFNEIKGKGVSLLGIFLRQFKSPFFYLLFIATIIAFLIGEIIDGLVISLFVFVNAILGFLQEARAEKAALLLRKYIPSLVRALRGGKEKTVDKNLLVPGDIVLLTPGDIVPADLRILKIENFLIDESVLSGESVPVSKIVGTLPKEAKEIFEAKNIIFTGTSVVSGSAEGIVIGTGKETVMGEITKLVSGIKRESAYERDLLNFSRLILKFVVVSITFIFLANLVIRGSHNFFEFLLFSIALIVSIIPEALPVVITFALSEGALKLAKEKVVVKRLSSVEDLGDIEILCTDKTGTITENKLRLEKISAEDQNKCLLYGLLSSSYMKEDIESALNPFDIALFEKASQEIRESLGKFKEVSSISFDSLRLRNSVVLKDESGNLILVVRGAPEIILGLSSEFEDSQDRQMSGEEMAREGREGKRILAVAFKTITKRNITKKDEKDLTFLGYFSFSDPLKDTAKEAIQLARKLGLGIKILTGDSKEVAGNVAKEVGLIEDPQKVILGETLNSLSDAEFEKSCSEFSVFARVSPQTKYKIVEALQKKYDVGFMGEGINDAPALRAANVAIAVKEATGVSQEVSDVILLEKDLRVIVEGISQGRNIFSNINKYIKCALASNFGNFYSIAVISLFIPFLPMLPVQILLGNLLSDFPLISIITDRVDAEELKKPKLYQLNKVLSLVILLALVSTMFDFIFFAIFYRVQPAVLQTLWFIESILTEILLIFAIRTRNFFLRAKRPSAPLLLLTILDAIFIVVLPFTNFGKTAFHFTSPPVQSLLIVFSLVITYFFVSEMVKLTYFKYWNNKK